MTSPSECAVAVEPSGLRSRVVRLDRPVFILSLDMELAWGSFDRGGVERRAGQYGRVRELVRRMLDLFCRNGIPATWAIVGHLFLDRCAREGEGNHNRVLQPAYSWWPQGWLSHDPFTDAARDPFFYAPDLVDAVAAAPAEQEIASHTFTHAILGDPECTPEVARSQLAESIRLAEGRGRPMRSLVFPRNAVGHLDVAAELGFTSFRGVERRWYQGSGRRGALARAGHYMDKWLAAQPPVYTSIEAFCAPGAGRSLFNLPASMFYAPLDGVWATVPVGRRVAQARRGIEAAIERRGLFHLWFHPFNLAGPARLWDGLEAIIAQVGRLARAGKIEAWTMAQTAEYLQEKMEQQP